MSVVVAKVKMDLPESPSRTVSEGRSREGLNENDCTKDAQVPITKKNNDGPKIEEPKYIVTTKTKMELSGTPRTEASSPGSLGPVHDDDVSPDRTDGIKQGHGSNDDAASAGERDKDDEDNPTDDEMPMSQTDRHIHQLDRSGDLDEVAGSQSMLSQELIYDIQQRRAASGSGADDDDEDEDSNARDDIDTLGSLHLSQETESSIGMAKRIGLLSMTQEDEEETETEEEGKESKPSALAEKDPAKFDGPCTPKRPASGFSMLSRHSNTGAPDLASFSAKKAVIAGENKPVMDITDTPVRESEGFGSLLDAVAKITEQEGSEEGEDAMLWHKSSYLVRHPEKDTERSLAPARIKKKSSSRTSSSLSPTRKSPRKSGGVFSKRKIPMAAAAAAAAAGSSSSTKKRKASSGPNTQSSDSAQKKSKTSTSAEKKKSSPQQRKSADDTKEAQAAAIRAAALAERIVTDPGLAKQLLLSMALVRENPRSAPETLPGPGHVLPDGFVWARYPPLENVLKKHMAEYYQLSTEKCQSAQQQAFNNDMVGVVREVADELRWDFASCFDDRALRDRIRCYYKTHIQNAKKRLRTMVRNPTKRANAKHLLQHLDIIEKAKVDGEKVKQKKRGSSP